MRTEVQKHPPSRLRDRGRNNRGTTSGSASPHDDALTVSVNTSRCFGRPRPPLLLFSGRPLREVFQRIFPLPCTNRQLSGGKGVAYFFPSTCLLNYPSKNQAFCQGFYRIIYSLQIFLYLKISQRKPGKQPILMMTAAAPR